MTDPTLEEIRAIVRSYADVGDDDALELSSLSTVQLAEEVEARLGLVLRAADLVPAHFGTVRRLADFVRTRRP